MEEDGEHAEDRYEDGRLGGWEDGCEDGMMGGWGVWYACAMMLAVLLFVGRADLCVDGCGIGTCIDVG